MVAIQLSPDEAEILRAVLENDIGDLRMEISNTDAQDFRKTLTRREAVLKGLVAQFGGQAS